jgi:pyrroline-5-carboxylate reductase
VLDFIMTLIAGGGGDYLAGYIFLIIDALADAGVKVGLSRDDASFWLPKRSLEQPRC